MSDDMPVPVSRPTRLRSLDEADFTYLLAVCTKLRDACSSRGEPRQGEWWHDRILDLQDSRREMRDDRERLDRDFASVFVSLVDELDDAYELREQMNANDEPDDA